MLRYGLPAFALLTLALGLISIVRSQPVRKPVAPPGTPPSAVYNKQVGAVGLVEASSENISVSLPVAGLVTAVYVKAGDQVRKGDKLFSLDSRDLIAERALRQSTLDVSQSRLAKLLASPRPEEIPSAEARVNEARETERDAEVQLQLMESVRDKRAIREEDLLRRRIAVNTAKARLAQAQADLTLLKAGAWKPDLEVARAEVAEAKRQVERVTADLDRLKVTAPITGEILQCKVRLGEYAQSGPLSQPLLLMGDTRRLNVRVDIDEQDAARVNADATASASPRGVGGKHYGLQFVRFEPYVIPKKNLTDDATERVDTRVLEAIYALDRGAPVRPGQQMDVSIEAK